MSKKYKIIYADPPWSFNNKKTGGSMKSGASAQYDTMSLDKLKNLDVESLCDDDCVLIMWWVGSQPVEAVELCKSWGFKFSNMTGFVWDKLTVKGNPHFGMGHSTRASVECALIGYRGKLKNIIKSHSVRSRHSLPVGRHSQKPNKFRKLCVELCGDVPRLEMFARQQTDGWDVFGNEVENSIEIGEKND